MPLMVSSAVIIQPREKAANVYRWNKTKKNTIPNPPKHPPGFRAFPLLLLFGSAVVGERGPVSTDFVLLEEFSSSVSEGVVGFESTMVGVGLIEIVVKGLMRVVPEVAASEVVGSLEVVGAGIEIDIEIDIETDIERLPPVLRHSRVEASQEYPGSQHPPKEHWVHPDSHGFRQSAVPEMHVDPLGQQPPPAHI